MANTIQKLLASDVPKRIDGLDHINLDILKYLLRIKRLQHFHIALRWRLLSREIRSPEEAICRILLLEAVGLIDEAQAGESEPPVYILAPEVADVLSR